MSEELVEELNNAPDPFEEGTESTEATPEPVVEEPKAPTPVEKVIEKVKKIFTRADVKKFITCPIHFPFLYPDFEPFEFDLRLKLSKEAQEQREEFMSLSAAAMTEGLQEQALNEICDLLVNPVRGFGDLEDTGSGPGHSFRSYVETSDPDFKAQLLQIVEGVDNWYWASLQPREFRRKV